METINTPAGPWWLMHLHNACYALMGIVLLIYPTLDVAWHTGLLGGLLLLAGGSTALVGLRRRQAKQTDNSWYMLSSLRDISFGITLLVVIGSPLTTMVNVLGLWGIMYAFLQAIEAMFYFLGTRNNEDKDYGVEIIHFICVLLAGGFAFSLIMRPDGLVTSLGFVGLFLIVLGITQAVLTQRLQRGNR